MLDNVLWSACERNGHDKEVCRWFKGLSGTDTGAVIGGGGLYRVWLSNTRQMYLKGVIDNTEVRERFRRLLGWAHSYVNKALREYQDFEKGVGGEVRSSEERSDELKTHNLSDPPPLRPTA